MQKVGNWQKGVTQYTQAERHALSQLGRNAINNLENPAKGS